MRHTKDKKNSHPNMDMNSNPVWDIIKYGIDLPPSADDNNEQQEQANTSLDNEINQLLSEIDEKDSFKKAVEKKQQKKNIHKKKKSFFLILVGLIIFLIMGLIISIFFRYSRLNITTNSMVGQLEKQERVLYNPDGQLNRFSVVLVNQNGKKDVLRVIGTPGDDVKMLDDLLFINQSEYDEEYLKQNFLEYKYQKNNINRLYTQNFDMRNIKGANAETQTIPANKFLLLGDNRQGAKDSREVGLYDESQIEGILLIKYWPLKKLGPIY